VVFPAIKQPAIFVGFIIVKILLMLGTMLLEFKREEFLGRYFKLTKVKSFNEEPHQKLVAIAERLFSRMVSASCAAIAMIGLSLAMRFGVNKQFFPLALMSTDSFNRAIIYSVVIGAIFFIILIVTQVWMKFKYQISFVRCGGEMLLQYWNQIYGCVFNIVCMMVCLMMDHYGLNQFIRNNYVT
jgi:hypothetical protein